MVRAQRERGGFIASLNVDLGVQEALARLTRVVQQQNYEIIQQDNEGFEAEIYIRGEDELGAIQIRTSRCDDKSVVFVNIVDPDRLGGGLPSPSPTA
ncbi:MAG: hypothetical protein M3161_04015 [Actinomycetota bacterium]|nr:hypothetical protein [Actinomycetota bacterium]